MSQPTPYARQYDFSDFSASNPTDPHPGVNLDAEYDAILSTLAGILSNLLLIQRDDGALKNGSVTLDTLSSGALTALAGEWTPRGAWLTATSYAVSDVVVHSTQTLVCAVAHTSGTFATDLAAGKWILLFDTAGTTPGAGTVGETELADGAVTTEKIGFTALDLTGSIRGQGGISAGTATVGEQMANKQATGDVVTKVQRATANQGLAAYRIDGANITWDMKLEANNTDFILKNGSGAGQVNFTKEGIFDVSGVIRATSDVTPSAGVGPILRWVNGSSIGYLDCYNYTSAAWKDLYVRGLTVVMVAAGTTIGTISSSGLTIAAGKALKLDTLDVGYLDVPDSGATTGSAITLTTAHRGKLVRNTVGGWAIPSSTTSFPVGTTIWLYNDSASSQSLTSGSNTLRLDGTETTGTRAVAGHSRAALTKVKSTEWVVGGAGVS